MTSPDIRTDVNSVTVESARSPETLFKTPFRMQTGCNIYSMQHPYGLRKAATVAGTAAPAAVAADHVTQCRRARAVVKH
jgi:hypothetical protein